MHKFLNQNKYMIYISQRLHKLFIYIINILKIKYINLNI